MLVASWNICGINGLPEQRAVGILERLGRLAPDVVLLQEVGHGGDQRANLQAGLAKLGLVHFHHSAPRNHQGPLGHKNYGSAIAARWGLVSHPSDWLDAAWGELIARATLDVDGLALEVISAHLPNGAGNGWQKIAHFEALAERLAQLAGQPVILGGDFNEPRIERPNGRWVCWGEDPGPAGEFTIWETWEKNGVRDTGARWDRAVRRVLADENDGGLIDACRHCKGRAAVETTHISRGENRFFDHILVSRHFRVDEMGFEHAWREEGWSDHSAVWARVSSA